MERHRGVAFVIAISLIIAVLGLGVAFAAFSTTLNITGSATVESSSWNIYFTTTNNGSAAGTSGVSVNPTASNLGGFTTTASGTGTLKTASFTWSGSFKTPGDKLQYSFYVCNKGSYNAKINNVISPSVTCTKGGNNETTVCGKISYGLYYNSDKSTAVAKDDTLTANQCKQLYLIAELSTSLTQGNLPNANVTVNPAEISITYQQY
jgi:hypothetical protein